ncbi:BatA and WFA domain-containing protein [Bizionia sediminis]|uniref:BatA and WFA domain-containing protein n=1 Tax=Bizionia sediminis TaxID=1737064 RepID=A0ABW5KRC7_9FLAO
MQFKHPEILYALFLLVIPIIVHLFQLRKFQKESFTNVAFLKQITLQTRKSSQIKKWLTLLTRMLLLACLIFAFAQPYTASKNQFNTQPETVIYLDNSYSMEAKGEKGPLLKRAIQELIENLDPEAPISVVTNTTSFSNTNLKSIQNELLQLPYAPNALPFEAALLKSEKLFSNKPNSPKNLVFISDFQEQQKPFSKPLDTSYTLHAVKLKPQVESNVSVDSVAVTGKELGKLKLRVFLKATGPTAGTVPVSVYNNQTLLAKATIDFSETNVTTFTLTENHIPNGKIVIEDAGLPFDNVLYFSLNKPEKTKVLHIHHQDNLDVSYIERLFNNPEFEFSTTFLNNLNYSVIENQQLLILNELTTIPSSLINAIQSFIKRGGYVLMIPNSLANLQTYNAFLEPYNMVMQAGITSEKRVSKISYAHPLYKNVFEKQETNFQYPKVASYYPVKANTSSVALAFEDGKPFLVTQNQLALFTSPLNKTNSNFSEYDLIVPTFYNIAQQSLKTARLYFTIGEENSFDVPVAMQADGVLTLHYNEQTTIPLQQYFNNKVTITTTDIPDVAGFYQVQDKQNPISTVSYNYARAESKLSYQNLENLEQVQVSSAINTAFDTIKSDTKINALWKWFVIFALVFTCIEMLILKYFK